ncbi:sialate O-acetylesterase [Jiulongibacter sp. NS-SX5]|uniref:sialate O-acetylesterase n=1 Tax=Jiulongibacter sp. NS-SX5 TaxID=3463854 RepID=UPI004059BD60
MPRKLLYLTFVCLSISFIAAAQVEFSSFPEDMQLYTRGENNKATVEIAGTSTSPVSGVSLLRVTDSEGTEEEFQVQFNLDNSFSFEVELEARLTQYKFEFFHNSSKALKTAEGILCGDTFVFYGQSNALALAQYWVLNDSISKEYTRNFTFNNEESDGWHDGTFPELGSLAKWFCLEYVEKQKVPVLIINGAEGGVSINYLNERTPEKPANLNNLYGRLLTRVQESKVNKVKGLVFLQGEHEAHAALEAIEAYPREFDVLKRNLDFDFPPIDHYYIYQLGIMNTHKFWSAGLLREYRRNLPNQYSDVSVISSAGFGWFDYDGLHYGLNGYKTLAKWLYQSFLDYEFNESQYKALNLKKLIHEKEEKRLKLSFNQNIKINKSIDFGYYTSYLQEHFYVNRSWGFVDSLFTQGEHLYLYYSELPGNTLTYLPSFYEDPLGRPYNGPYIKNDVGIPALTFFDVQIEDQLPIPVVENSKRNGDHIDFEFDPGIQEYCPDCALEAFVVSNVGSQQIAVFDNPTGLKKFEISDQVNENATFAFRHVNQLSESKQVFLAVGERSLKDTDFDAIPDGVDNCIALPNSDQFDFDSDGIGDLCDDDADGDGIIDDEDNCLLKKNPEQPKLEIKDGYLMTSSISGKQYHWIVNGEYSETTNDNLYIIRNTGDYGVFITDEEGCASLPSESESIIILSSEKYSGNVVYPSPFQDYLTIVRKNNSVENAELVDMNGRLLLSSIINSNSTSVSTEHLAPGQYILLLKTHTGQLIESKKVSKL